MQLKQLGAVIAQAPDWRFTLTLLIYRGIQSQTPLSRDLNRNSLFDGIKIVEKIAFYLHLFVQIENLQYCEHRHFSPKEYSFR